jgi:hypothetical protein
MSSGDGWIPGSLYEDAKLLIERQHAEIERLRREIGILKALLAQYEKPKH